MSRTARRLLTLAVLGFSIFCLEAVAQAECCGNGGGYGFSPFSGYLYSSPYAAGRIPTPPYFALHPPVYYSGPVPRSYGYSPFPYPGTIRTPEVVIIEARTIVNPYVQSEQKQDATDLQASRRDRKVNEIIPEMVRNPYADSAVAETQGGALRVVNNR